MLYLGDRAAPSTVILRTSVLPSELTVGSSTSVTATLDGRRIEDVPPAEIAGLVAARRVGHLTVELENRRAADAADVRATYVIEIAIPEPEDLASVDRAFVRHLAIDRPSTREVEAFASEVERFESARAYAGSLADYVHGALVKEVFWNDEPDSQRREDGEPAPPSAPDADAPLCEAHAFAGARITILFEPDGSKQKTIRITGSLRSEDSSDGDQVADMPQKGVGRGRFTQHEHEDGLGDSWR